MTDRLTDEQECKIAEAIRVYGGESTRTPIGALATCMNTIKVVLAQAKPQPVDDRDGEELATDMMNAYFKAAKEPYIYPPNKCEGFKAALRVAADRLLAEPSNGELCELAGVKSIGATGVHTNESVRKFITNRRARLTAKKTPEQEVAAIIEHHLTGKSGSTIIPSQIAAEIIANLRESEGKQ